MPDDTQPSPPPPAGMIFLAERAEGQKKGGQALLGGLDILVSRNFFGAQINSFECPLAAPAEVKAFGGADTFRAVFIRAPAVLETGPSVQVRACGTTRRPLQHTRRVAARFPFSPAAVASNSFYVSST